MRLNIILTLIVLAYTFGCGSNKEVAIICQDATCNVDKEFCAAFEKAIYDVQFAEGETSFSDRQNAMFFFSAVTGIESSGSDFHHPIYDSKEKLQMDLNKWEKWFLENRCRFTKTKSDSLIKVYRGE